MAAVALLLCLAGAVLHAADLQPHTLRAFEQYRDAATEAFLARVPTGVRAFPAGAADTVVVGPAAEDGIIGIEDGLIHHWRARGVVRGVRLQDVLAVSKDYDGYSRIYKPVTRSELLEHAGDTYTVLVRLRESGGGVNAVLDVRSTVQYTTVSPTVVYALTHSDEIRQVVDAGAPDERRLAAGHDSGYLWRASAFTRFVQVGNDVYVEMETLGLSRGFPPLLGWIIEPIARRLGRRSVEESLREFAVAIHEQAKAAP
ncbi:MAG: hypothetical protein AB7O67_12440 [Vicinamibacterales bacterium]